MIWTPVNCPSQEREETSTTYKTFWEYRVNEERPTGKKYTTIEWDDGGKIGNKNRINAYWNLPIGARYMIFKTILFNLFNQKSNSLCKDLVVYCIVLYCIEVVVIAAHYTATF